MVGAASGTMQTPARRAWSRTSAPSSIGRSGRITPATPARAARSMKARGPAASTTLT